MLQFNLKRKAVAMIELIFAIVIMGIALMSAPTLLSQASQGSMSAVQQEAIVACATEINMIMTRQWDENDTNESDYAPILVVDENITALNEAVGTDGNLTGRRIGTPQSSSRSFITANGTRLNASLITALGPDSNDNGDYDDIDDFNGKTTTLVLGTTGDNTNTETGDYIDTSLSMDTNVTYKQSPTTGYNSDTISLNQPFANNAPASSNIKSISTKITSSQHDNTLHTNITLKAFMCNIGTYVLKRRTF